MAGLAATGMYLDAKHSLRNDVREIIRNRRITKLYAEAGMFQASSPLIFINPVLIAFQKSRKTANLSTTSSKR